MRGKIILLAGVLASIIAISILWVSGSILTEPSRQLGLEAPTGLPIKAISFLDSGKRRISGWYVPNQNAHAGIVLLHGIRSDRRSMIARAKFLHEHGYAVMLIDLASHGQSDGNQITFGYTEADGITTAIQILRKKLRGKKIAIIGSSLGGASAIIAAARNPRQAADAYVVEAVFSTLSDALENRLTIRLGKPAKIFTPVILWQLPLRLGFKLNDVSPVVAIKKLHKPIFIISGEKDKRTTLANTKQLFSAANHPKTLWVVKDAKHVDLHNFAKQNYEKRILVFLKAHL